MGMYKINYEIGGKWMSVNRLFKSEEEANEYAFQNLPYEVIRCKTASYEIERVL